MKESYCEELAPHTGLESCVAVRKDCGEALTEVRIGQVLSREMLINFRVPTLWVSRKAILGVPLSLDTPGLCAVRDLGMYGNTLHGNREIPRPPAARGAAGRIGKSEDARR